MNSTGTHPSTGKTGNRLRSLMIFNRHRRIKPTQLPGKPSSRADLAIILVALLTAAALAVLVFTHIPGHP
jgi:hypothetical protein